MTEIVSTLGGGKEGQTRADGVPEFLHGAPTRGAEQRFQLREPQLNRIQIGAVGRQVPKLRARRLDPLAHALDVMGTQVVHHDDVVGPERGDEDLIEVGEKTVPVHRPIEQSRRSQASHPQRRDERAGLPVLMRRVVVDAGATATAAVAPQHVRRDAAFIEKHEPGGVNRRGDAVPVRPGRDDVGAIPLGRAHRCF